MGIQRANESNKGKPPLSPTTERKATTKEVTTIPERETTNQIPIQLTMFLDEKLYQHVKNTPVRTSEDFNKMYNGLLKLCEGQYKGTMTQQMSDRELKAQVDRSFNAWDLMVRRLSKEDYPFTSLLREHSFRYVFMDNSEMKHLYEKLCRT